MATPGVYARIAFGVLPGAGEPTPQSWIDVSDSVKSLDVRYGRSLDRDRTESGTVTLVLSNVDSVFSPWNSSSPYFGNMLPMVPIEVAWVSDSISGAFALDDAQLGQVDATLFDTAPVGAGVFRGNVTLWTPSFLGTGADYEVSIQATDLFKYLQAVSFTGSFPAQTAGQRISAVLTAGGIPFPTAIDQTGIPLAADTVDNSTVLSYLQTIELIDGGLFYSRGDGRLAFTSRATYEASSGDSNIQTTIGDDPSEIGYRSFSPTLDEQYIVNKVTGNSSDGTPITPQEDATSQGRYLLREFDFGATNVLNVADLQLRAKQYIVDHANARVRIDNLTFELTDGSIDAATLVNLKLLDRIRINRRPNSTSALVMDALVHGAEHRITASPRSWVMTLVVASVPGHSFILGTAVPGVDAL